MREVDDLDAKVPRIGPYDLAVLGVDGRREQDLVAPSQIAGHHRRLRRGAGAVVHGGVGHIHPGERAEHALVLVGNVMPLGNSMRIMPSWFITSSKLASFEADHAGDEV